MLSPSGATIRLFVHVLAATIWVGGQLVLGGLVKPLRAFHPDAPRAAAKAFNRIAWPAFFLLVFTGIWNLVAVDVVDTSPAYQVTLMLKIAIVAASGMGAFAHTQANGNKLALALGGAVAGIGSVVALFLGILLHSH